MLQQLTFKYSKFLGIITWSWREWPAGVTVNLWGERPSGLWSLRQDAELCPHRLILWVRKHRQTGLINPTSRFHATQNKHASTCRSELKGKDVASMCVRWCCMRVLTASALAQPAFHPWPPCFLQGILGEGSLCFWHGFNSQVSVYLCVWVCVLNRMRQRGAARFWTFSCGVGGARVACQSAHLLGSLQRRGVPLIGLLTCQSC